MTLLLVAILTLATAASESVAWPQWGGPSRTFAVDARDLATSWPPAGPRRLWQRPLGPGLSAIVTDGHTLYTMFRDRDADVVIALDATKTGIVYRLLGNAPTSHE